jgi:hypothetical protein
MWLLMRMHADGATGVWTGNMRQLANAIGSSQDDIEGIVQEWIDGSVGEIERDGSRITLKNRRMIREAEQREADSVRKATNTQPNSDPIPDHFQTISDTIPRARADYDYDYGSSSVVIAQGEEEEARARVSKSVPFDADQVRLYALMVHLPDHSKAFFDHYESVGWRHGPGDGKPVRDWQARYRRWCEDQRERDMKPKNGTKNGHALTSAQRGSLNYDEQLEALGYKPADYGG